MLLRSPEVSLAVIASFFASLSSEITCSSEIRSKLISPILTSAKSVTLPTRSASLQLFNVLFAAPSPSFSASDVDPILPFAAQIISPLKLGKTSSPDHRTTLFTMLGSLPAASALSPELASLVLLLLPKESNEITLSSMMLVLLRHLPTSLASNATLAPAEVGALVKGMQELKPTIRRAICSTVGEVLWSLDANAATVSTSALAFCVGVLPGLEFGLKTMLSNPLNSPAGPLEGYIAVAVLKGRLGKWDVKAIGKEVDLRCLMHCSVTC